MFSRIVDRQSAYSLIFARIIYAINWYNIASLFAPIAINLHQSVSGLGLITAAFYIGLGLFQVPGGILATRIGPRKTAIVGTVIASAASLLIALVTELYEIVLMRFFVGLGMALVFAPSVVLVSRTVTKGSEGFAVGVYNSTFYMGGALGLFGWAALGEFIGWRPSLLISGGLGLLSAMMVSIFVPEDTRRVEFKVTTSHLRTILLDRWLIAVSITLLSLGVGSTIFSSFVPYYAHQSLGIGNTFSGALGGLGVLLAFVISPFAGRTYDTSLNIKRLLFYGGILMAVGISVSAFSNVYATAISAIMVGIASGGFTLGFSSARDSVKIEPELEALAVSWVNGVSLFGSFVPPLIFSATVIGYGYPSAWLVSGILTLVLLMPLLFAKAPGRRKVG